MWRLFLTLYLLVVAFLLLFDTLSSELIDVVFSDAITEGTAQDMRGWLVTLDYLAERETAQSLNPLIERISRESGFPVSLLSGDEVLRRFPDAVSQLEKEDVFFIDRDEYELLYSLRSQKGILKVGPIPEFTRLDDIDVVVEYIFIFLLAVVIFVWHAALWKKLVGLERMVVDFGEGDLAARVSERSGARLGKLNRSVNDMAEKISYLLQQNKQLIRAVSHELRSPISRLRCQVDLMDESGAKPDHARYLNDMSDDISELENLVDEILRFSRMETMDEDSNVCSHDLKLVLNTLLSTINREHSREIPLNCPDETVVDIDKVLVSRAVGNLVQNAVRYCNRVVEVSVEVDELHSITAIHVDDDGPGIPAKDRERIFEPFARLDESRTRKSGGYGLGLAIVKQVAELHGGAVLVSTSPLGGSRFSIMLA